MQISCLWSMKILYFSRVVGVNMFWEAHDINGGLKNIYVITVLRGNRNEINSFLILFVSGETLAAW